MIMDVIMDAIAIAHVSVTNSTSRVDLGGVVRTPLQGGAAPLQDPRVE